ncbi:MAG: SAM-dependent methyltransferase [Streptosporangiaceae bacterium]
MITYQMYYYQLGGKDNFAADRAVGDQMIASLPAVQVGVRASATRRASWSIRTCAGTWTGTSPSAC